MKPNGPAVEGVNVTRRSSRAGSSFFSQKDVTVQGGYGAIFASPGEPVSCPQAGSVQSRKSRVLYRFEKLIVTIKLSR